MIYTFCLHCPWCPIFLLSLIQFDAAFHAFIRVILVCVLAAQPFVRQPIIISCREELFITFSSIFSTKLTGFVCKVLVTFISLRFISRFGFFILRPLLCFCRFMPFIAKISSWLFIVSDEDFLTFLIRLQPQWFFIAQPHLAGLTYSMPLVLSIF